MVYRTRQVIANLAKLRNVVFALLVPDPDLMVCCALQHGLLSTKVALLF